MEKGGGGEGERRLDILGAVFVRYMPLTSVSPYLL